MKMAVQVQEVEGKGLMGLLGERVTLFCMNYIYTGSLAGVNDDDVKLDDPSIVYETGSFDNDSWEDAQKLPSSLYVTKSSIESYTILKG